MEACRDLPGATTIRPKGASFELLKFTGTRVLIYPWRYASSAQSRHSARMRTSGFRHGLLTGEAPSQQLTFDQHAHLSEDEIELQFEEEADVLEQLRSLARVVTVGYASNPHALLELGWGDAELVDGRGSVRWQHWEDLPLLGSPAASAAGLDITADGTKPPELSAPRAARERPPRFDDTPFEDDDFGLRPRTPLTGEPTQEPAPPRPDTGTGDTGHASDQT